jgi:hypothetical protein
MRMTSGEKRRRKLNAETQRAQREGEVREIKEHSQDWLCHQRGKRTEGKNGDAGE